MLHRIAHLLRLNDGHTYSWYDPDNGALIRGWRCRKCGDITCTEEGEPNPSRTVIAMISGAFNQSETNTTHEPNN